MKKNNQGFSILVGMFLIIILTLSAYVILSYMIPFSQNTKGIENASRAYYYAYGGIESSLLNKAAISMPSTGTGFGVVIESAGDLNPIPLKGNSDINSNYNKIGPNFPVQMEVGNNTLTSISSIKMYFKVPAFTGGVLTFDNTDSIISLSLSSTGDTLYINDFIKGSDIKNSDELNLFKSGINSIQGKNLAENDINFYNFYRGNCINNSCILKLSVINPLKAKKGSFGASYDIPYLEYKIDFGSSVPLYYTNIEASGKSYGFKKDLKVRVPQQTLNQAFDFTVFQ